VSLSWVSEWGGDSWTAVAPCRVQFRGRVGEGRAREEERAARTVRTLLAFAWWNGVSAVALRLGLGGGTFKFNSFTARSLFAWVP
jgi:hypothetical protein